MLTKRPSGNTLYWCAGNTVRMADIVSDTAVTDLVTDANMIGWWLAGDTVVFTAYITGTDIGTYKVEGDGTVTLMESSDMEIKDIVEFTLP